MVDPENQMYEIINDARVIEKYQSVDIYTNYLNEYRLVKNKDDQHFPRKRLSEFLNKRLFIRLEDRIKMLCQRQYVLGFELKKSMKVDIPKARNLLKSLIDVSLSVPRSEILAGMDRLVSGIVDEYLEDPRIVSGLAKVCTHDYSTQQHLINVMLYCMGYARYAGMARDDIKVYGLIGLMHDIGKMDIPDYLLQSRRKLTRTEFKTIRKHPKTGWEICRKCGFDVRVRMAAHEHHERMDGSGYPTGKTGPDLSEPARILAIIDTFEAMTSWRPYKKPVKPYQALDTIKSLVVSGKLDNGVFRTFAYSLVGMASQPAN